MASTLTIDFATGADRDLALQKLQIIVDGAIAPDITIIAIDNSGTATAVFPDATAPEQVLACFEALVNTAGVQDSGLLPDTISLTGDVVPGTRQRTYSV